MTKPCFLTKTIPAFLAVFLCPPPQAAAIQGGEKDIEKNKEKLENRGFTNVKPCFLIKFTYTP